MYWLWFWKNCNYCRRKFKLLSGGTKYEIKTAILVTDLKNK